MRSFNCSEPCSITRKSFPNITLINVCDFLCKSNGGNPWLKLSSDVKRRTLILLGVCLAACIVSKCLIERKIEILHMKQLTSNLPTVYEAH